MCAGRGGNGAASGDVQMGTEAIPTCWVKKSKGLLLGNFELTHLESFWMRFEYLRV